jgi:hypothetical protein
MASSTWQSLGPAPINRPGSLDDNGRVAAVAIDPTNTARWFIGGDTGGVWETLDQGKFWIPRTDGQLSLAIGAIAFAPSDPGTMYVGTGNNRFGGTGLLRSTDFGTSWEVRSQMFVGSGFSRLLVSPGDQLVVSAAVLAPPSYYDQGHRLPDPLANGIFRSNDGGETWQLQLSGRMTDLIVHPGDFRYQYAGLADESGEHNGLYRTLDGGENWQAVTGPWNSSAPGRIGRVALAVAPSDPDAVYAFLQEHSGSCWGLWRTTAAWGEVPGWEEIELPKDANCSTGPGFTLIVHPLAADVVYLGIVVLYKFDGTNWFWDPSMHPDQVALAFADSRLVSGNDGGVASRVEVPHAPLPFTSNSFESNNGDLSVAQFYAGCVESNSAQTAAGGMQDNGVATWRETDAQRWKQELGGDGYGCVFAPSNPARRAATSNGRAYRTLNGGTSWQNTSGGIPADGGIFVPLEQCPTDESVLLLSRDTILYRSDGFFDAPAPLWQPNGPPLPGMPFCFIECIPAIAFAPSPAPCTTYAIGTIDGRVALTVNGGSSWSDLDPGNSLPDRPVFDLTFSASDPNVLYAAVGGYDGGTPGRPGHVLRTRNALASRPDWVDIGPPIDLPANAIRVLGSSVFVGTDRGAWRSHSDGATWVQEGPPADLPNVRVYDLRLAPDAGKLFAFTYGRGAFHRDLDRCDYALSVPTGGGSITGYVTPGTIGSVGGTCGAQSPPGPEQMYAWRPQGSGMAAVSTCGETEFDAVLSVWEGDCKDGKEAACSIDAGPFEGCGGHGTGLEMPVVAGTTYFIVVEGLKEAGGQFTLNVIEPPAMPTSTETPVEATPTPTASLTPISPSPTPTTEGGPCCAAHSGTGCDIPDCQACVCSRDDFCCSNTWDSLCASHPECQEVCECAGGTPTPTAPPESPTPTATPGGPCCDTHGGPGCDLSGCEACVCGYNSFCCTVAWDVGCVGTAVRCAGSCGCEGIIEPTWTPQTPPDATSTPSPTTPPATKTLAVTATSGPPTSSPTETPTPATVATASPTSSPTEPRTKTVVETATLTPTPSETATPARTVSVTPSASATLTASVSPLPTVTLTTPPCTGDCNDDKKVTVDELVRGVRIALGEGGDCPIFDADHNQHVSVDELVRAVGYALGGCPSLPGPLQPGNGGIALAVPASTQLRPRSFSLGRTFRLRAPTSWD